MVRSEAVDEDLRKKLLALWNTESSLMEQLQEAHGDELLGMLSLVAETRRALRSIEDRFKQDEGDVVAITNERIFILCGQAKKDTPTAAW